MKKSRICFGLLICCFYSVVAEGAVFSWDFSDCEIKDILFAVSLDTGISIVPDDTVSGKVDLKFAGDDFDKAFESFLKSSRLYVKRESDVWTVSKIMVEEKDGVYSLEAYDLLPVQIVEKLSEVMDCAVTFETLPAQRISVHFKGMKDEALLGNLAKRFGDYKVLRDGGGFQFVRNAVSLKKDFNSGVVKIERVENGFSVDVAECRFSEIRFFS